MCVNPFTCPSCGREVKFFFAPEYANLSIGLPSWVTEQLCFGCNNPNCKWNWRLNVCHQVIYPSHGNEYIEWDTELAKIQWVEQRPEFVGK